MSGLVLNIGYYKKHFIKIILKKFYRNMNRRVAS